MGYREDLKLQQIQKQMEEKKQEIAQKTAEIKHEMPKYLWD